MRNAQLARTLALRAQSNQQIDPAVHNAVEAKARAKSDRAIGRSFNALLDSCYEVGDMETTFGLIDIWIDHHLK